MPSSRLISSTIADSVHRRTYLLALEFDVWAHFDTQRKWKARKS